MNRQRVLIIGGAGFIGSHTADELHKKGYKIRILDNLNSKTHTGKWPKYLKTSYEKIKGDARNRRDLLKALRGVNYVIHLAAQMDLLPVFSTFFDINVTSTALLYELIVEKKLPIKKVVVASSQFVYGEGRWFCQTDGIVFPKPRLIDHLSLGNWDPVCPHCRRKITPLPNLEHHQDPPNQYAISKYNQELIALKIGQLYNIPSVAMRYSIVHGPRQSLKNVYSGALRIFTLQLLADSQPTIFEDGMQQRDFVSVFDVAAANALVLEEKKANYQNFNVGGGKALTIRQLASLIAKKLNKKIKIAPNSSFRLGDIRHAVSDITKLKRLNWRPKYTEEQTLEEFLKWVRSQNPHDQYLKTANDQLNKLGVILKKLA